MELGRTLTEALERLRSAGRLEVHEDGAWLAALEGFRYEVRERGNTVLLHLWSEQRSLVRRVLSVVDQAGLDKREARSEQPSGASLAIEVERFGRASPSRLEFAVSAGERAAGRIAREQFRARFRDLLTEQFPDEKIASLATAADLRHSLSGNYTRGMVETGSCAWAVIAAAPEESAATCDGMLTFGLLWLNVARESAQRKTIAGLRLFFPAGAGRVIARRLQAVSASIRIDLYEYNTETWRARDHAP